jgi:hypothetical protein
MRVVIAAGELTLGEATLSEYAPEAAFPLLLPAGARQLAATAIGEAGRARLDAAEIVPEAVVPRSRRDALPYPERALDDRYRVGGPLVRATALDRSEPESGGFRLDGPLGRFALDGPPASSVRVEVRRTAAADGDGLRWAGRAVDLGSALDTSLVLPLRDGENLGRAAVVPVELRAAGAWVRFTAVP